MDSNPDKVNQNQDPIFSSDQLANTKARAKQEYFTNVTKERPKLFSHSHSNSSDQKRTHKKIIIIFAALLGVALIAAITLLLIFRPWEPKIEQSPEQGTIVNQETGEIEDIDIEKAVVGASMPYVQAIIQRTMNIYDDAVDENGEIIITKVIENIDKVVSENNITDPAKVMLFDFEKARNYLAVEDIESAREILDIIDEDNLFVAQADFYYYDMYLLYSNLNNESMAASYIEKRDNLPTFQGGL